MRVFALLLTSVLGACTGGVNDSTLGRVDEAPVAPLYQAHAHNDYEHARPLFDALEQGFMSVEADVFAPPLPVDLVAPLPALPALVDLYVAHDPQDIRPERTLRSLYLDPLLERFEQTGAIHPGQNRPFQLLVDFKTEAETTWAVLEDQLAPYSAMLTRYEDGVVVPGAVTLVISGNRPINTLGSLSSRVAFVDGRLSDLENPQPVELMPLISNSWSATFSWKGEGPMPADEYGLLQSATAQTHALGASLRFWATPDTAGEARTRLWTVLADEGLDHINTDDLEGLAQFLRQRENPSD